MNARIIALSAVSLTLLFSAPSLAQHYVQGGQTYAPQQNYGQPVYGHQQGAYVQPQQGYGQAQQIYGQPQNVYGQQQPVYGQPNIVNGVQPTQPGVITKHWSQELAPEKTKHEFGVVPSFSNQEYLFEFVNNFEYPIHLVGVRASCGCTKPSIVTHQVAPGETAKVLAKYDTKNFRGNKKATVSVSVRRDQPYTEYGEVQFEVEGTIRRDVVLNPGTVNFSDVTLGEESVRSIQLLYAGNPEWKITDVKSTNPNIAVEYREIQRNVDTKRVDYELMISLSGDQLVGTLKDQIILTTNDVANKNLAVNIDGNVKAVVQVSPVRLGVVAQDQNVKRKLIVRGHRPFEIKSVSTGDSRIKFSNSEGAKTLHIIQYELDTSVAGAISSKITIETDDPEQGQTSVPFEAQIVPETYALDKN